jgi:hypothetical protein
MVGLYYMMVSGWSVGSRKSAPEGSLVAYHMLSKSEDGLAPYGDYVVLVSKYKLFSQYFSEPVFAGYCSKMVELQWLDYRTLQLNCNAARIVKQSPNFKHVEIKYVPSEDDEEDDEEEDISKSMPMPDFLKKSPPQ